MTGPYRVALLALGCKVNFAEMADLAGELAAAGCDVVAAEEPADVRVVNSCTVTTQADATTRQRLRQLRRLDPYAHIVLTGCSVDANPGQYMPVDAERARLADAGIDSVFANRDKQRIAAHVLALAAGRAQPRADANPVLLRSRAFLKVQDGCDHRCTYCIVWRARGESRSVAQEAVLERAQAAIDAGQSEIVLTGVDLGSYGRDVGTTLAALVTALLARVGDTARIRLSSVNANDMTPSLIELNAHPRLCSHWHMPLQSGSDRVLRAMHRGYRRQRYLRVVRQLREHDPLTEFTTDVMVGFPGETDGDHEQTLSLIDEVGFLSCHVFRWSPRPDTPAADLGDRVPDAVARRRSAEARGAASRTGHRSRVRACGRTHEVVWDHATEGSAHGLSSTFHEILVADAPRTRPGTLGHARAVSVDGEVLRATLQRP